MVGSLIETSEPEVKSASYPPARLKEWRKSINIGLFHVLFGLSMVLGIFVQQPFLFLVILHLALPWLPVGLAACFPGDFTLTLRFKGATREGLAFGWFVIALYSMAAFEAIKLLNWHDSALLGCLPGAIFLAAVIRVNRRCAVRATLPGLVALTIFSGVYGYSFARELNFVLDHSPAAVHPAIVMKKRFGRSSYLLEIAQWAPQVHAERIRVTRSMFDAVTERDRVCIVVKKGALGMPWYTAQPCPWNGKIEFP